MFSFTDGHFRRPDTEEWTSGLYVQPTSVSVLSIQTSRHPARQLRRIGRRQLGLVFGLATTSSAGPIPVSETSNASGSRPRRRGSRRERDQEDSRIETVGWNRSPQFAERSPTGESVREKSRRRSSLRYHRKTGKRLKVLWGLRIYFILIFILQLHIPSLWIMYDFVLNVISYFVVLGAGFELVTCLLFKSVCFSSQKTTLICW
jgi:hypothetical protein